MTGFTDRDISLVLAALKFSAERHRNQRRKDTESTPYINHPIEVAERLWREGGVRDIEVIVGALLHDIIEDTKTRPEEIKELFGAKVLSMVLEVSDDKSLPKLERKRLQIEHAPHLSLSARLIKLSDKIGNVQDVTNSPPEDWSHQRRMDYLDWTEKVVQGLRGCSEALEALFDQALEKGRAKYR